MILQLNFQPKMNQRSSQVLPQSVRIQLLNRTFEMQLRKSEGTKPTLNSQYIEDKPRKSIKIKQKLSQYDNYSQSDRKASFASTNVQKFKKNIPRYASRKIPIMQIKQNYDIMDLTYTLIQSKMKIVVSAIWFFAFLVIRVYTFCCCIYISTNSEHLEWIAPFLLVRIIFFILVMKISLNDPTTKTQIVLKTHWNSIQNDTKEYFEVASFSKLFTSILRGLIPAQLSFLYIKSEQAKRKYEIFTAINFIFVSIEQIVFYPFFIIYCSILAQQKTFTVDISLQAATILIAAIGLVIFMVLTTYLLILGVRKKYGGVRYWYNHKRYTQKISQYDYMQTQQDKILDS